VYSELGPIRTGCNKDRGPRKFETVGGGHKDRSFSGPYWGSNTDRIHSKIPPVCRKFSFCGTGLSEEHQITFAFKRAHSRWNPKYADVVNLE
jgi:hypothetical protein